jgi:acetyl esterase
VVAVDYSIAPGSAYPQPLKQVNAALAYLQKNAALLHVDASRIVLAGDSAGSQIAAQLATIISVPDYARTVGVAPAITRSQLSGVLLYCGAYDMAAADFDGPFSDFLNTVLWSYSGHRDFKLNPEFAPASVVNYVDANFPPAFVSAGNDDPLEPQSKELAATLAKHGVRVDALFFPSDYAPALPHEYQFSLDTEAGRTALTRSAAFLHALPRAIAPP